MAAVLVHADQRCMSHGHCLLTAAVRLQFTLIERSFNDNIVAQARFAPRLLTACCQPAHYSMQSCKPGRCCRMHACIMYTASTWALSTARAASTRPSASSGTTRCVAWGWTHNCREDVRKHERLGLAALTPACACVHARR